MICYTYPQLQFEKAMTGPGSIFNRREQVLAPNAKLRKAVVPVPPQTVITPAHAGDCAHTPTGSAHSHMNWARLLKRAVGIAISTSSTARTVAGS